MHEIYQAFLKLDFYDMLFQLMFLQKSIRVFEVTVFVYLIFHLQTVFVHLQV